MNACIVPSSLNFIPVNFHHPVQLRHSVSSSRESSIMSKLDSVVLIGVRANAPGILMQLRYVFRLYLDRILAVSLQRTDRTDRTLFADMYKFHFLNWKAKFDTQDIDGKVSAG